MKQPLTLVTPREAHAVATPACDVLFVLSSLAVGGSERKIARMANRLKEEGVAREPGLSQRAVHPRVDVAPRRAAAQARAPRQVFVRRRCWRLRQMILRERPATVVAVNLYQALYVACATLLLPHRPRIVALVNTSTFRGRRMRKRLYQSVLPRFDLMVHGSRGAAPLLVHAGAARGP